MQVPSLKRYLWMSDLHMDMSLVPYLKRLHARRISSTGVDGLFITGDISTGLTLESDLKFLARHFDGPIYFVLGNHDYHGRHVDSVHADVRRLCCQFSNLHWMSDTGVVSLNEEVALIGTEGWYDAQAGDPRLLRFTTDWFLTFDFLHLDSMEQRVEVWRDMSRRAAEVIEERLTTALEHHKTVYVLTHFPPWKEATRAVGTLMEGFWLPYNTDVAMGQAIERVAAGRKKKRIVVLAGHTHTPCRIRVSNTVECNVARASYWGWDGPEETIVV